jgi:hypothetical protein
MGRSLIQKLDSIDSVAGQGVSEVHEMNSGKDCGVSVASPFGFSNRFWPRYRDKL